MEGKGEEQSPAGGPLKKGPWTSAEDAILIAYVQKHGEGNWNSVQKHSGLYRCGKSCRLRWANHLRPNLKKGAFTAEEERLIIELHAKLGNKWAKMATQLPGRTDNEIKNYWNTRIKRRQRAGLPVYPPDVQKTASPNCIFDQTGSKSLNSAVKSQLKNLSSEFSGLNAITLQRSGSSSICRPGAFSFSPILSSSRIEELKRSSRTSFTTTPIYKAVPIPQFSDESSICLEPYLKIRRTYGPGSSSRMASFSSGFALEPDPGPYQNFLQTGHSILNSGPFSCAKPDEGLKLELPSSQSTDSVESGNNPHAQFSVSTCPISESDSAGSISSSSGLLEAFLQGRKPAPIDQTNTDLPDPLLLLHNNNQLRIPVASELGSACRTAKWNEETSPPSSSLISALGDQNFLRNGSFWQTALHQLPRNGKGERGPEFGSGPYSEEEISNLLEYVRPGLVSSSATDWYNNSQNAAYNGENNNCPPFENAGFGTTDPEFGLVENPDSGNRHSWPDHQLGIGIGISSCPWNNMPGASQPSDFLPDCKQMVPPISSQIHDPCALLC